MTFIAKDNKTELYPCANLLNLFLFPCTDPKWPCQESATFHLNEEIGQLYQSSVLGQS